MLEGLFFTKFRRIPWKNQFFFEIRGSNSAEIAVSKLLCQRIDTEKEKNPLPVSIHLWQMKMRPQEQDSEDENGP